MPRLYWDPHFPRQGNRIRTDILLSLANEVSSLSDEDYHHRHYPGVRFHIFRRYPEGWKDEGPVLSPKDKNTSIWSGDIILDDGIELYYTESRAREGGIEQCIRKVTLDEDYQVVEEDSTCIFPDGDTYAYSHLMFKGPNGEDVKGIWRDPFMVDRHNMLLAACSNTTSKPCIGHLYSEDRINWQYREPFFEPDFGEVERPQMYRVMDDQLFFVHAYPHLVPFESHTSFLGYKHEDGTLIPLNQDGQVSLPPYRYGDRVYFIDGNRIGVIGFYDYPHPKKGTLAPLVELEYNPYDLTLKML